MKRLLILAAALMLVACNSDSSPVTTEHIAIANELCKDGFTSIRSARTTVETEGCGRYCSRNTGWINVQLTAVCINGDNISVSRNRFDAALKEQR